ncbi:arginyl-tRNA synthetase [Coemansia sp. RSA 1813]|nr:arginyl-tRNA synthetase [Coemansia sp. RSA 1646]KAJ1765517.1 arginyl-tRNA synthetase [Coemansia sp. RSA 1843]KAJ2092261.1 arginyl-tRNA synthetase [Coemansia sp. RSA 986]KAJ2211089.1 arginyl-tRNA synthetase [Coemansia sp. RSA 487]KAJ2564609.1 arginyl-tRNA synthetase [Coemansia sp. RSA 1813]
MLDIFKTNIATQLVNLTGLDAGIVKNAIEVPDTSKHGDLALSAARLRTETNPVQLAQTVAEQFTPNEYIAGATATGPYVNFQVSHGTLARHVLPVVHQTGDAYGRSNMGTGRRVVVDFSSPNIAKPFHVGHMRSTIQGNFVCNLHKLHGWDVVAMNYLGDWGTQYGLLAIGFDQMGSEHELVDDPIMHLYRVYVAINQKAKEDPSVKEDARAYFKKMEDGDPTALAQWQRFRALSIDKYMEVYGRLGIHFDVYSGESHVSEGMDRAISALKDAGLLGHYKGAQIVCQDDKSLGTLVVKKSDGASTYLLRDIGAAIERHDAYHFDKMIYVVGAEQECHMKRIFKTVGLLGLPFDGTLHHVGFGKVAGMSTREGDVVFLDELLDQSSDKMHGVMRKTPEKYASLEEPEHTASVLGQSCVYIQDMSAKRSKGYRFELSRVLSFEGNTGAYLQYTHVRLCSLARKHGVLVDLGATDFDLLSEKLAKDIVLLVAQYPDTLAAAMQSLEPCVVVQYLFALCHAVSAALEELRVGGQSLPLAHARMAMYQAARIVIANALLLLGIPPLERM